MIPAVDNNHVAEGVAYLTSRYNGQPVITGLVTSCMQRLQQIEDAFWAMINAVQLSNHPMPGGPWDVLDKIGMIVGAPPRNGLDDTDYLALIKLQAEVNTSRGNPDNILQLGAILSSLPPGYLEMPLGAFYLTVSDITSASFLLFPSLLKQARPTGVYALLIYTTWPDVGDDDYWASRYGGKAGQGGWGSRYTSAAGGVLAAAQQI